MGAAKYSIYIGDSLPDVFYEFKPDMMMEALRDDILNKTGKTENFRLICSNVESIAAVLDTSGRYILYSRRFFNREDDPVAKAAMLAQAIGHCVQEHTFDPERIEDEEMEADEFMGYALCLIGVPLEDAAAVATKWPRNIGLDTLERQAAILRGYSRAEASLLIAEHASWFEKSKSTALERFPRFPFPAPRWSADADLDDYFQNLKTMADADKKIRKALDAAGFYSRKYFQIPEGFALVTRMEQFNPDGTSKSSENRWKTRPVRNETFSITSYFASFFTTEPGYFRVFVFLVTDEVITSDKKNKVSRKEATNWLNEGACRLPDAIGSQKFGKHTGVTALVYEFHVPESTREPVFAQPSELPGMTHLRKALILGALKK